MKSTSGLILLLLFQFVIGTVQSQNNIILTTPNDGDTIENKNPLLAWTYLGGISSVNNRTYYRLLLVELKPEQSAAAGIIINNPILKMDNVAGTQLFYPYDAPELEEGKRYGWQVQKIVNNVLAEKSDASEFIIAPKEDPKKPVYYRLKVKNDGSIYHVVDNKIYFYMEEPYKSETLEFYLYDSNNKLLSKNAKNNEASQQTGNGLNAKSTGSNFYELDLGDFAKSGNYKLLVFDAKKKKYEVRFKVN